MRKFFILLGTLAIYTALPLAAHARLEVMQSSLATLRHCDTFPDNHTFALPKDSTLRLWRTTDRSSHTLKGSYKGTLTAYPKTRCPLWKRWLGQCTLDEDRTAITRGNRPESICPKRSK